MVRFTGSLSRQLMLLGIFVSTGALLLAAASFMAYDVVSFRDSMVRSLTTDAEILGKNTSAAVLFHDNEAAANTLSALRAKPNVVYAEILTPDGKRFAHYLRADQRVEPAPVHTSHPYHFEPDRLIVQSPIASEGSPIATLVLHSDLRERQARLGRYLAITAVILLMSVGFGLVLSSRLQRNISTPILELVEAARSVSEAKNYALRVRDGGRGEVALLARAFNDMLSQIERQDAELRLAVQARDEFLSIASHELKTPLTPLTLQIQKLQNMARKAAAEPATSRMSDGLEVANRQIERLTRLVSSLLDISRITSGRLRLEYEEVDLDALVREVIARTERELNRANCQVTFHSGGASSGLWDRMRLDQVITNLLTNAMKYGAGHPIEIWSEGDGIRARVRIRDHGIGIAPEDQARIFQRFERAVSEHNYGGFGLGLWIVRQVIDAFGGTITVQSTPGEGATFSVELPRRPPEMEALTAPPAAAQA